MLHRDDLNEFRPNVGICLFNSSGRVWFGKRTPPKNPKRHIPNPWQFPQGGIDKGEAVVDAAYRELFEETGIRSAHLLFITPGWLAYEFPPNYRMRRKNGWRGQRQKWAVMLFDGDEDEIDLDAHDEKEFVEWRWGDVSEAEELVVPFKRGVYGELVQSVAPLAELLKANGLKGQSSAVKLN